MHELEDENMAYVGAVPWHGLGVKMEGKPTPHEMMQKAGLNWTVQVAPVQYRGPSGKTHLTGEYYLVRDKDDKVLSSVPEDYSPVQNHQAFEFFTRYCENGELAMETAGSLRGGKNVWGLGRWDNAFSIGSEEKMEPYLLFSNPHTADEEVVVKMTFVRVVCANTLGFALREPGLNIGGQYREDPQCVHDDLEIALKVMRAHEEEVDRLMNQPFYMNELVDYLYEILPTKSRRTEGEDAWPTEKKRQPKTSETTKKWLGIQKGITYSQWRGEFCQETNRTEAGRAADSSCQPIGRLSLPEKAILNHLGDQPGGEIAEGSWWHAYNTVTYVLDHHVGKTQDSSFYNSSFGDNARHKQRALRYAMFMAQKQHLSDNETKWQHTKISLDITRQQVFSQRRENKRQRLRAL